MGEEYRTRKIEKSKKNFKFGKNQSLDLKGQAERSAMEAKANARFTIHFIEWFYPKKHQGFIVNLRRPLSEAEIESRMAKGFGDL